jgi:hypothetical protein
VAQLYPWALNSLYVVSYDLQGYGGGILILLQPLPNTPNVPNTLSRTLLALQRKERLLTNTHTDRGIHETCKYEYCLGCQNIQTKFHEVPVGDSEVDMRNPETLVNVITQPYFSKVG